MRNIILSCLLLLSLGVFAQTSIPRYELITVSGTDTYTATVNPAPTFSAGNYITGYTISVKFSNNNTGASTINLNTLGAKPIRIGTTALTAGQINSAYWYLLKYDGTYFQLNAGGGGGGSSYIFSSPLSETGGTVSIANSSADGSTKGAATFTSNDFDASSGVISIDYTNGQAASGSNKGFLTSGDWTTFNSKQSAITFGTGVQSALGNNIGSAGAPVLFNGALGTPSSGVATNLTGTASGLTAGTVTTNANLTGAVTSVGNATSLGSFTWTAFNSAVTGTSPFWNLGSGGALTANNNLSGSFSVGFNVSPAAKMHIQSLGNTSGTNAFIVQNSSTTQLLALRDDGKLGFGNGGVAAIAPGVNGTGSATGGGLIATYNYSGSNLIGWLGSSTFSNTAAGLGIGQRFSQTFNPTSGTSTADNVQIFSTINQTGGANGNSSDLHILPTRTAVGGRHDNIVVEDSPLTGWSVFGGTTPTSTLTTLGSFSAGYVAKTANYTLTAGDYLVECTTGSFTITLPTAVGIQGRMYIIKNTGAGTITIATTGGQTSDGVTSLGAGPTVVRFMSNNANWITF